ncbi:S-layer homology domain-containing protein [Acidaminobacter sp. JC074]|uniref:S-layer homology domain-containing protein n=1 Tax=Acidaminobacter sp. JC074 TaxID=2530199 RepID=UPI001F0EA314|nr:S-layer homology domain-containing protein [Acidaminobacter sp. JC074]MCH4890319.1 S-layer homology domain-containing protein [Acidaminobacter sp. JC074]
MKKILVMIICMTLGMNLFGQALAYNSNFLEETDLDTDRLYKLLKDKKINYSNYISEVWNNSDTKLLREHNIELDDLTLYHDFILEEMAIINEYGYDPMMLKEVKLSFITLLPTGLTELLMEFGSPDQVLIDLHDLLISHVFLHCSNDDQDTYYLGVTDEFIEDVKIHLLSLNDDRMLVEELTNIYITIVSIQTSVYNEIIDGQMFHKYYQRLDALNLIHETSNPKPNGKIAIVSDHIPSTTETIDDVKTNDWRHASFGKHYSSDLVSYSSFAKTDLLKSKLADLFKSDVVVESDLITRGEFVQLIYDLSPNRFSDFGQLFSDHAELSENKIAIYSLRGAGIIAGYEDNTFRTENILTCAEAAVILDHLEVYLNNTKDAD